MDEPAHVPELGDDPPAGSWTASITGFQPLDLLFVPQAGRIGPAEAFAADPGRFGDDQAGAGALGVIVGHERRSATASRPARARVSGAITIAVGQLERTELKGIEQGRHSKLPVCNPDVRGAKAFPFATIQSRIERESHKRSFMAADRRFGFREASEISKRGE